MAAVLQLAADLSKVRLPSSPSLFFLLKTSFKYPKISINSSSHIPIRCLSASASPQHQSDPRLFHQPHHNPNPNSNPSNWSTPQNPSSNQQWSSQNSSPNQQWNCQNRNPNPNQWSHQNPNSGQQWRPQNHAPNQQWTPPNPDPNQWRPPRNPIPNQQWSSPDHNPIHNQQWGAQNQRPPPIDHRPPVHGSASAPGMQPAAPHPAPVDLAALCLEGKVKEAVEHMGQGALADRPTFFCLIAACSTPKLLDELKKIHDFFTRSPFRADLQIKNKLIEMCSKLGSMADARRVFDRMPERSLDTWHLMINGYANNGQGDDGLQMFEQMRKVGIRPTAETFGVEFLC